MEQIKPINRAIAEYTQEVSKWKKVGGKGETPEELVAALDKLADVVTEFYEKRSQ